MKITPEIQQIIEGSHPDPFNFLGQHSEGKNDTLTVRTFQPGAYEVVMISVDDNKEMPMENIGNTGVFIAKTRRKTAFSYRFKVVYQEHSVIKEDPYCYPQPLGDIDVHLLNEGTHHKLYDVLGAHKRIIDGVEGFAFAVWAPNASRVSVVGDFNEWDGRRHVLKQVGFSGFWNIFIPEIKAGANYKYEIKDGFGNLLPLKADPVAGRGELRPNNASVIDAESPFYWQDKDWMTTRELRNNVHAPISIYEVHLGSWRRSQNGGFLNYRDIAEQLIPYVKSLGFTHIQLMPVSEHPFDGSWGYQPVGLFAPTARFGSPDDFKYFVDRCHQEGVGLLIDWVPGHFPSDAHGLARFDGTCVYEHQDPREGYHPDWNTYIYNFGRTEVANFLKASATVWLDRYHVDGIRVDAVASMLYRNYSRKEGEWIPNKFGGHENLEAVDFLRGFNEEMYADYPGAFSVAEESTAWPGVSRPTSSGGLGFGFKWNMGWMNDTLEYMKRDPIHRSHHHNEISFGLVYSFDENFILPLSHDEVVHGKGSILSRMPGDTWQQFANLRAYYGFMWTHPGKKLLFMGGEFAQGREWNYESELDWNLLNIDWHHGVQTLIRDLNNLYTSKPALHELDCDHKGFEWIDHENAGQSIYSYVRKGREGSKPIVVVVNFTPQAHENFRLGVPSEGHYTEIFNSDAAIYGGSNVGNIHGAHSEKVGSNYREQSICIKVPPLATVIFELQ
jgi:1,4-alpha-glucan branching enzyme